MRVLIGYLRTIKPSFDRSSAPNKTSKRQLTFRGLKVKITGLGSHLSGVTRPSDHSHQGGNAREAPILTHNYIGN